MIRHLPYAVSTAQPDKVSDVVSVPLYSQYHVIKCLFRLLVNIHKFKL